MKKTPSEQHEFEKEFIKVVEQQRLKMELAKKKEYSSVLKLVKKKNLIDKNMNNAIEFVNYRFEAYLEEKILKRLEQIAFDLQIKIPEQRKPRRASAGKSKLKANHNV